MRRSTVPPGPADFPLSFDEQVVSTPAGKHSVLVATPCVQIDVGHMRMAQLREKVEPGPIDREILRQVRRRSGRISMLMMCGQNTDASAYWRIDPALPDGDAWELGYLLSRSQVPTHRRFLAAGVVVFLHVHFGAREVEAYRRGVERLTKELSALSDKGEDGAIRKVDLWVLRHLSFYFTLSSAQVLHDVLPGKAALFESRVPRIKEMLQALPKTAID